MTETMRDLQKPLAAAELYKRSRTIGDEVVTIQYVAGGSFCNVTTYGPEGSSSKNHRFESDALRDFAGRVLELQRQADTIHVGDEVIRTAEPDGPRGIVRLLYRGLDGHTAWAKVSWGGGPAYGSPLANLSKAPAAPEPESMDGMLAEELARPLRDAVRAYVAGGGEQFLDMLVMRAEDASILADKVKALVDTASAEFEAVPPRHRDATILATLLTGLRAAIGEKS